MTHGLLEGVPEHVLDDELVAEADPERQPPVRGDLRRHRLLRKQDWMARIGRDDRGAEFDVGHGVANERQRDQRVPVEDLRQPQ